MDLERDLESLVRALLRRAPLPALEEGAWSAVLEKAARHGVEAWARRELASREAALPGEARATSDERLALERLEQERIHATLAEVLATLEAASVSALALKGPVLGERVHGDGFLRPSSDVDVSVAPRDLDRAVAALAARGFAEENAALPYFRRHHHH